MLLAFVCFLLACNDSERTSGPEGTPGEDGVPGAAGGLGADGAPGSDGLDSCVNVLDFGGVGDGVVDDTLAIQAAVDSLSGYTDSETGAGGRVCIPGGTWRVTQSVEIPDYVTVQGEGMWATLLVADPAAEPLSVFARRGENAVKNVRFVDLGVMLRHEDSIAFDLRFVTRSIVQRCLATNVDYVYHDAAAPPAGTGVRMEADATHSGYDNRVLDSEMYGLETGILVGPTAHAATIMRNTITGGKWAVYITDEGETLPTGARITHNRFEAMEEAFVFAGGQDAFIEDNWMEAYGGDGLSAAVVFPPAARWNLVGANYITLSSTPAAEVADEGQNNSWSSYYTRVVESRVSGDNLEQRVVRVGDDLPRGLAIRATYVQLGSTVRVESRSVSVVNGATVDPALATHVDLTGPATGVTLGTSGTDVGALLLLTGSGASVEIVSGGTADIAGESVTLGGGNGAFSGISLVYGGSGRWLEVGRSAAR